MRNIIIVFLVFTLCGCGAFKKVFKSKVKSKTETVHKSKKDSTGLTIDKSKTVIKEKADTSVTTKEKTVQQDTYLNMDSLVNGLTVIKNELVDVRLLFNPVTGILSAKAILKPETIDFRFDKETTIQNDINQQIKVKEEKSDSNKQENKSNVVQKDPAKMGIWLIVFVLIIGSIYLLVRKKF